MMSLIVTSMATVVRGDEYSANIERAIVNSRGLQAVGALDALSARLLEALCESDETSCEAYKTTRKSLWLTFGNEHICKVGSDADATWQAINTTSTQGGIAVLLSKCSRAWLGDLEQAVLNLAPRFLAQASLQRADVDAVIKANDAAAGRAATQAGDDLDERHPSYIANLAPIATELTSFSISRPVVVTATATSDESTYYSDFDADVQSAITAARNAGRISVAGSTEACPDAYVKRVETARVSLNLYRGSYLEHPYAKAHYDKAIKCVGESPNDALCYKRVVPEIGYTHSADGTRLLSPYGESLAASYVDYNQPATYVAGVRLAAI
jgi:hypothetical protein